MGGSDGAALVTYAYTVFWRLQSFTGFRLYSGRRRTPKSLARCLQPWHLLARTAARVRPIACRRSACESASACVLLLPHACIFGGIKVTQASEMVCKAHLRVRTEKCSHNWQGS